MESLSDGDVMCLQMIVHLANERGPLFELDLAGYFTREFVTATKRDVGQVAPTGRVVADGRFRRSRAIDPERERRQ